MDGLSVEFLPEANPPGLPGERRRRDLNPVRLIAAVAVLVAAGALLAVAGSSGGLRNGQGERTFPSRPVGASVAADCIGASCAQQPSPSLVAAFQDDLPGAVVMDETTDLTSIMLRSHQALQTRLIHVLYGNVLITIVIEPRAYSAPPGTSTIRYTPDGYQIDFSFNGYYPPTGSQIHALANDARLISL